MCREEEEERKIARESEIAGLPGLQRLSVILCVSHPIPGLRRRWSICAKESIYTHTRSLKTHIFSLISASKKYPDSSSVTI